MLLATHKCVVYWPASHAIVTCYPLNGFHHKPPLCKGRWHFRKKMTVGLLLTSLSSFCSLRSISQSLSLAFARQLPLHKGAFDTIKFCPCFLFAFSSSAEPLLNHATLRVVFVIQKSRPLRRQKRLIYNILNNALLAAKRRIMPRIYTTCTASKK